MRALSLILAALAFSGCLQLKHQDLGPSTATISPVATPTPGGGGCGVDNGAWPVISNFNLNVTDNNGGGGGGNPNDVGNDNEDGCGASASSASLSWQSGATCHARFTYNVVANAGCGYQYAAFFMPMVAPNNNWTGRTGISFQIKADAAGRLLRIMARTQANDPCLGSKNRMWYDYTSVSSAWVTVSLNFSSFSIVNAGCPYPLTDVPALSFVVETAGQSGTFEFDDITLLP